MNATFLTELLDARGQLEDAQQPGTYAVAVDTPQTPPVAKGKWDADHDARPGEDVIERVADAEQVAYVGASQNVYSRLCEHVSGDRRRAAFLKTFPVRDVIGIWPTDNPFESEYNRAVSVAADGWLVWCDGEVI